jgi:hypothetical protein
MKTIVELVEQWYAENRDVFAKSCDRLFIRSYESHDAGRGKAGINIEHVAPSLRSASLP